MGTDKGLVVAALIVALLSAVTVYAASKKNAGEACQDDSECKGHCYKKKNNDEVCVDCSSSTIRDARNRIASYCKTDRTCKKLPSTQEVSEEFLESRIETNKKCIKAREDENDDCWDGGDTGHNTAVTDAKKTLDRCEDELRDRQSNGFLYTCSDSTYNSKSGEVKSDCAASGSGCAQWKEDDKKVDCDDIDDAMEKVDDCVDAIDALDSSCLPRLSRPREKQKKAAHEAFKHCEEVLKYKKSKSLCD